MKDHFTTIEAARKVVEPLIGAWQFAATLEQGPGKFELMFKNGKIEDRNPTPGLIQVADAAMVTVGMDASPILIQMHHYPEPPAGMVVDIDAQTMLWRYSQYRQGRDTLAGMGYFCLTILQHSSGGRAAAVSKYNVAEAVLKKLSRLTSEKGGANARKGEGRAQRFSRHSECDWVDAVVKKLIWRAAEIACSRLNPAQITMADLPNLK